MSRHVSAPDFDFTMERDVALMLPDGVRLYSDVYRPKSSGLAPVILIRTPYGKRDGINVGVDYGEYFARRGYMVVIQDVRGMFASEGQFYFLANEAMDGFFTVEWAASLPGSNGKVATAGQSYYAYTQYLLAPTRPPHLVTMFPISGASDFLACGFYQTGGAMLLGTQVRRLLGVGRETARHQGKTAEFENLLERLGVTPDRPQFSQDALARLPTEVWGEEWHDILPNLRDHIMNPDDGPLWWQVNLRRQHALIDVPMFHLSSWYDAFLEGALYNYMGLRAHAMTERARSNQKLLIGPWPHIAPYTVPTTTAGDADFGPGAAIDVHELETAWFDYWLKDVENGITDTPPVRYFVMGANDWRDEQDWPPPNSRATSYYFHGCGGANSALGDGVLDWFSPQDEPPDGYTYDPLDPVPTAGGNLLGPGGGVRDQAQLELRHDVLVYTSAALEAPVEVTGHVSVRLFASSSAPDTDFTAKLVDVEPSGYVRILCDGVIRARYRTSRSRPKLLTPGEVYEFEIDMLATSHVFGRGHRIRVEISSSNFPKLDRNPNTGTFIPSERNVSAARQTVYHNARYPSRISLPLISR